MKWYVVGLDAQQLVCWALKEDLGLWEETEVHLEEKETMVMKLQEVMVEPVMVWKEVETLSVLKKGLDLLLIRWTGPIEEGRYGKGPIGARWTV